MVYRFDRFQADDTVFRLSSNGVPVPLEPKTLRLLLYLIENRGRLVRKQELLDAVWQEAAVSESALTRAIGLLRKSLNDDSREPRFIETVPTAGYRFIAQVETVQSEEPVTGPAGDADPMPGLTPQTRVTEVSGLNAADPSGSFISHVKFGRLTIITAACLAIIAAASWLAVSRLHATPAIRSLAVLPLMNLSGDPAQDYFADGMTDELITELAHVPNLRVVSRTSVMLDKNAKKPLPEIGRELGVDAIVEGSTVRSGDRVRITAQLIDARTDRHLWAQSFEGSANDILGLQDSVAQQIASQARLVLLPSSQHRAVNPEAHDAYLRGRYFFNKQDVPHSLEYFERAISLDPNYASAYAGYATALDAEATFGLTRPEETMPKAQEAARRAIELDPNNGEAYTELGSIQTIYSLDWPSAEQNLTRGILLNPNDSIAEFKYAVYLDGVGRAQDAVTHMRRAVQLDPLSFFMNRRLGVTLYLARDYDGALAQLQRAAEMEDQPSSVDIFISLIYEKKAQYDKAVQHDLAALHGQQPKINTADLLAAYRQHGLAGYWRARNQALLSGSAWPCRAYEIGVDDIRVNDLDHGFESLEQAIDDHCYAMALIRVDPLLDSVRQDPRYAALLRRIHQ